MDLVTLEQAKAHLRIDVVTPTGSPVGSPGSPEGDVDGDLLLKISQASEIVRRLCVKVGDDVYAAEVASWVSDLVPDSGFETVPPTVQGIVLFVLAVLWRFRGDDEPSELPPDPFQKARQILEMTGYRDPGALA